MKKYWWLIFLLPLIGGLIFFWPKDWHNPFVGIGTWKELNLEKYDFDNLKKRGGKASKIKIIGVAEEVEKRKKNEDKFKTQIFTFESEEKIISGTVNIPNPEYSSLKKAIILIRGYAELEGYYSGSGTWKVAEILANEGYATFSIDFLGYGESDKESNDMLEARFIKVANVMDLIESIKNIPWINKNNIGIWAHSNGGQIALSVLETTGENYPTVLWAPMTQTFPESVLSTIDEGSPVKGVIEDFLKKYDSRRYAFKNYYEWLNSPVLIQQGTADDQVKVEWQNEVVEDMKKLGKEVELVLYPNNDHNLSKSWDEAVKKDTKYLNSQFERK